MHTPHWSPNPRVPLDRFGQPLSPGDLVVYTPSVPCLFQVSDIRSVMDPSAPPGSVRLTLTATAIVQIGSGTPEPAMMRVGYTQPDGKPMVGSPYRNPAAVAITDPGPVAQAVSTDVPGTAQPDAVPHGSNGHAGPVLVPPKAD